MPDKLACPDWRRRSAVHDRPGWRLHLKTAQEAIIVLYAGCQHAFQRKRGIGVRVIIAFIDPIAALRRAAFIVDQNTVTTDHQRCADVDLLIPSPAYMPGGIFLAPSSVICSVIANTSAAIWLRSDK